MTEGNPSVWAERFKSLDTRLLGCIHRVWPLCVMRFSSSQTLPIEDAITLNLLDCLAKDAEVRRIGYFEYQYEPLRYDENGIAISLGKIDLACIIDNDRNAYLAYECKRLNVQGKKGRSSLATEYAMEGLQRFVTEQYSEHLPIGCMLGYVMDSDVQHAKDATQKAINVNATSLKLVNGINNLGACGRFIRYQTSHNRQRTCKSKSILIYHTLLPFC